MVMASLEDLCASDLSAFLFLCSELKSLASASDEDIQKRTWKIMEDVAASKENADGNYDPKEMQTALSADLAHAADTLLLIRSSILLQFANGIALIFLNERAPSEEDGSK
jgi:hypothetical protein